MGVHDVCLRHFTFLHTQVVRQAHSTSIFQFLEHTQQKLHQNWGSIAMEIGRISTGETGFQ
jgi:hypothetical protein